MNGNHNHINEKIEAVRVGGGSLMLGASALTLNEWIMIATLIYFILQIGLLIIKYWDIYKARKK